MVPGRCVRKRTTGWGTVPTVKEALSKLRWHEGRLAAATVFYTHRGAPGDTRAVRGSAIVDLGASFFTIRAPEGETAIPYHRIQRVEVDGRPYWDRVPRTLGDLERLHAKRTGDFEQL